jgi:TetR/AcrR family transcriptional regulator
VDVRDQILREATRLFAGQGFDGTSVQEVADAVGIRKPSLLYHFASKDELRIAVLDDVLAHWNHVIPTIVLKAAREQQFEALMDAITSFFTDDPDRARLLLRETIDRPDDMRERLVTHVRPWIQLVADQLERGKKRGSVRADVDTEAYATVVSAMVVSGVAMMDRLSFVLTGDEASKQSQQRFMRELVRIARASLYTDT